ncbi:hypothetical protein Tco_1482640 [Tanacetum coccineum]
MFLTAGVRSNSDVKHQIGYFLCGSCWVDLFAYADGDTISLGDADMQLLARVSVFISKDPFTALTSSLQRDLKIEVHKSLIKAILTGSLYVERAKAGVDFGIFVRAQVSMLSKAGCKLLEIRCDEHDRLIGESQFVTHTVGSWVEMMVPLVMCMVCLEVHYTEMSSIEKGIVALTLEDNVRSLVMVAVAYKHYSWYCKVHGEIEGELSDEANVAGPAKVLFRLNLQCLKSGVDPSVRRSINTDQ